MSPGTRINKFTVQIHPLSAEEAHGLPPYGVLVISLREGKPDLCRHHCPCGCGGFVALPLVRPDRPRSKDRAIWDYVEKGLLIAPSIRDLGTCRAHYHIHADGSVVFCSDSGKK